MFELPDADGVDPQTVSIRVLVDTLPAMVSYWGADFRCRFANRAYEKWFGITGEAMIGRDMREFLGPLFELNRAYVEGVLRGEAQEFERDIPDPRGGPARAAQVLYIPDVVDGNVRGFSVLVTDITRRKHAEESLQAVEQQLRVTERLAAMATLASGVAHEINNPLAAVLANIEYALDRLPQGEQDTVRAALTDALEGGQRVRDIVRSMRLFARGDTTVREPVDVDATLERSLILAANVVRYRAHLVRELGGVGHIDGNAAKLAQVFLNLIVNAAQALPEEQAATNELRVTTSRTGDRIIIEITDNGCGIAESQQARIFEPFFTTKQVGGGAGLGLSVASGIVSSLGGTITLQSKVSQGSTFRIELPAVDEARRSPTPVPPSPSSSPASGNERPRLLVVDDEVVLAHALERLLAKSYDVTVATDGRKAIALVTEGDVPFDAILCDLMMPEVGGVEVYEEVKRRRPEVTPRFIFMTGGAFTPRGRAFLQMTNAPVIEKPFDLARVRAVIASVATPPSPLE